MTEGALKIALKVRDLAPQHADFQRRRPVDLRLADGLFSPIQVAARGRDQRVFQRVVALDLRQVDFGPLALRETPLLRAVRSKSENRSDDKRNHRARRAGSNSGMTANQ